MSAALTSSKSQPELLVPESRPSRKMISQVVRKHLKSRTGEVRFWGCARFKYSTKENRLTVPVSLPRKCFAALNFGLHLSYAVFIVLRLLQYRHLSTNNMPQQSMVFLEFASICFLITPFISQLSFFLREDTVATFVNQYLTYYKDNEGDGDGQKTLARVCDNFQKFFVIVSKTMSPLFILLAILKPGMPMLLSSLSHNPTKSLSLPARLALALPYVYIVLTWWSNIQFFGAFFFGYLFSTLAFIKNMRSEETGLRNTDRAERYRCLQLLQSRANEILKYPLGSINVLFLLGTIRCIYGIVKMDGAIRAINLNGACGFTVFLAVVFKALGQVYEESGQLLNQQRSVAGDKWFRKFHRSCRPVKFEVAGMFFVDPPMSLTMALFVAENVANMLILNA